MLHRLQNAEKLAGTPKTGHQTSMPCRCCRLPTGMYGVHVRKHVGFGSPPLLHQPFGCQSPKLGTRGATILFESILPESNQRVRRTAESHIQYMYSRQEQLWQRVQSTALPGIPGKRSLRANGGAPTKPGVTLTRRRHPCKRTERLARNAVSLSPRAQKREFLSLGGAPGPPVFVWQAFSEKNVG